MSPDYGQGDHGWKNKLAGGMDNAELNDEIEALEAIFSTDLKGVLNVQIYSQPSGPRQNHDGAHVIACP